MPKRSCPWPESAPPQRKTRVTERAACGEAGRSAVFERTRALLFSGARSLTTPGPAPPTPVPPPFQGSVRGQLRLGPRGELLRTPPLSAGPPDSTAPRCALCLRTQLSGAGCARCERAVCGQCQQRCSLCQRDHCFTCCLPSYEGHEETLVCADCAPR
ncbi:apoptosis regulatory protein Siva-like isoform X2 [Lepisosteus oculatus]|uniref:apoptosis regulatory protein Siva-like isoform X2 n=1 Tax=Lepisosteus oculatus TaxID=7918 RepID=UPI0035F52A22